MVPTRELVVQVVQDIENLTPYMNVRFAGIYGGTNINTQKQLVHEGLDILVATPGRLLDLALDGILKLKHIRKFVIDEVDEMLNLGFRPQLETLLDLLPQKKQNILFSATLTNDVENLLDTYFKAPVKIEIAASGSPLTSIQQLAYPVPNFYTKLRFLMDLLKDRETFKKVLVFVKNKRQANLLYEELNEILPDEVGLIHSNKTQNFRLKSIKKFDRGSYPFLIATDIVARGLDFSEVSHVINFDVPDEVENYMHRMGRTGRAEQEGTVISLFNEEEADYLGEIELFMNTEIEVHDLPDSIKISSQLTEEELPKIEPEHTSRKKKITEPRGAAFHEKSEKNSKVNLGGSYRREIVKKYKKPKTRGQKRK